MTREDDDALVDDPVDPVDPVMADLARAIADGTPVAWPSSAHPAVNAGVTHQLRTVQQIAALHRAGDDASGPLAMTDAHGEWWGHLKIAEVIGHGAFGDVYRAWDSRLDREVALKIIRPPDRAAEATPGESPFVEEARMLARVHHPNVLTVFGADTIDGRSALWTEFIRGRTLHQIVVGNGPLSTAAASAVALDVCRALSAVHRAGLLHRDVKAQNVMVAEDGRIVLMDFGAGHEHHGGSSPVNPTGTPLYAAPEVLDGQPASVQSDVYSLGVLLYYLVTASFPTPGTTVAELVSAHREARYRRLKEVRPELPAAFVAMVERAIDPQPGRRFQTAHAFETTLSRFHASTVARGGPAWRGWLGVGAAVAAALSVFFLSTNSSSAPGAIEDRTLTFVTNGFTRPSPDGRWLAHLHDGDVRLWDTTTQHEARRLTPHTPNSADDAESGVTISFDGTQVAHSWKTPDGASALRIVQSDGTNPRTIPLTDTDLAEPLEWSRDGRYILTVLTRSGGRSELAMVPTTTGTPVILQTSISRRPKASLSPDGQYVVNEAPPTADRPGRHLMITRTDGSAARVLLAEAADASHPFWTPDGRHILFLSARSGPRLGWLLAIENGAAVGEPVIALRTDLSDADPIGLTTDGDYYYWLSLNREVFIRDINVDAKGSSLATRVPAPTVGGHRSPGWSPDGRRLAFVSGDSAGEQTVTISTLSTGAHVEVPLLLSEVGRFGASLPQWTPDAQVITIRGRNAAGQRGYFNINLKDGTPTPVVLFDAERSEGDYGRFRWLPDGRFVYADRQRGLIARTPAGEETVLFAGAGLVSPVDLSIASAGPVAGGLMNALVIHTAGLSPREVLRVPSAERIELHAWSPDGSELILTTHPVPAAGANLSQVTAQLLKLRVADATLLDTGIRLPVTQGWAVAVSPDGRQIAYEPVPGAILAELHVVKGFLSTGVRR